ncbi:uncharacterized protein [Aristolochia californica]|uniref:uncharacterized protein isoform X1 n=1 Tax=Aristolochia californica TaxID=171875 RepID=UPI0035D6ACCA
MADKALQARFLPVPSPSEQRVWADVSPLLDAVCQDLPEGELIHGENFSLFAAMSALEIMDPKMDSGMESCGYRSVEEAIENNAAPIPFNHDRTIDVQCTIDVMDHLLACEATWHMGHSLAQTVFSCIYLLRLERTSLHALLHSFCRIVRATCNSVISVVSNARTHEEEDIFIMAHGLPLKGEGDEKCLSMLQAVEETVSRQLRACKALTSKKKVSEDIEPLQTNLGLEEGYCKAILCRLRFRKHFYHTLICMRKPQGRGFELAKRHIDSCLSELAEMVNSSEFLASNASGTRQTDTEDCTTASGCQPVGFDASLNSRFSAPTPPRAIKILGWKKAVKYFEKLLHDLDIICSFSLTPFFEDVLRFVVQFQKSKPDLVARAHLQILLVQDGKLYGRDYFYDVISRAISLPDVIKNQELHKSDFVVQLGQLVVNLLKVLCTNTAWQRRKLGKILQDWSVTSVQLELALKREFGELSKITIDENICIKLSKLLLIWSEEQTFWIASRFLMLGFELELYSSCEYCMVYWYLYIILVKLSEKTQMRLAASLDTAKKKGKKKRDHPKDTLTDAAQFSPLVLLLRCYICLSKGLAMMLAALSNERMISQKPSIFNSEQERFIQHFDLLQKAHVPDQISYVLFKKSTFETQFASVMKYNYFGDVQRISKELRGSFASDPDRLAELRQIEQVAEHNRIALNVIHQAGALDRSLNVTLEFSHHPCFAVAVVRRS